MAEVHPWKYVDPERHNPGRKGMLLSNQIEKFCDEKFLIAEGYEPKNLRPAAYTLRVGSKYVDSRGRQGNLDSKKKPYFKMEPNSIVYVSTHEKLDLPCYIAARFNLRVKWVYKGILLGTGPQVEPGYRGYLSCPLYNLTDRPIRIDYMQDFATIDFERTTDFCVGANANEISREIISGEELDSIKWSDETYIVFKQKDYPPLKLLPDHDVISSLLELSHEVKTWRNIGIGFAVSFFALTLTLLSFGANVYRQVSDLTNTVGQLRAVQDSARERQDFSNDLTALREKIAALESQIKANERTLSQGTNKR
jgi:deoxycytidine triphosphate deaminase